MIGIPAVGNLERAVISGVATDGLSVTVDGKPAELAVIDMDGQVVESGPQVALEAWNVTLGCYKNYLVAQGHCRVHTGPPGKKVV